MHDLAPDEPPCAPATRRIWVWHPRWGGHYLVRCVATNEGAYALVARHQTRPDAPLLHLSSSSALSTEHLIRKGHFRRTLRFDIQGRLLLTPDAQAMHLTISSRSSTLWCCPGRSARGHFQWQGLKQGVWLSRQWIATKTAAQIDCEVGQMLADPNSDCSFAWNWAQLSDEERFQQLYLPRKGTLNECEHLIRAVLWNDPTITYIPECGFTLHIELIEANSPPILKIKRIARTYVWDFYETFRLSPHYMRLLELVIEGSQLQRNPQIKDKTAARKMWSLFQSSGNLWFVTTTNPTQHERLEARLQLREWLRDKVSPDELTVLLT